MRELLHSSLHKSSATYLFGILQGGMSQVSNHLHFGRREKIAFAIATMTGLISLARFNSITASVGTEQDGYYSLPLRLRAFVGHCNQ